MFLVLLYVYDEVLGILRCAAADEFPLEQLPSTQLLYHLIRIWASSGIF